MLLGQQTSAHEGPAQQEVQPAVDDAPLYCLLAQQNGATVEVALRHDIVDEEYVYFAVVLQSQLVVLPVALDLYQNVNDL